MQLINGQQDQRKLKIEIQWKQKQRYIDSSYLVLSDVVSFDGMFGISESHTSV